MSHQQRCITMTMAAFGDNMILLTSEKNYNKLFPTDILLSDLTKCLNVSLKLTRKMTATTFNQTPSSTSPLNYCVLPTQHSHSFPRILLQDLALDNELEEDLIFNGQINVVNEDDQKLISQLLVSKDDGMNNNGSIGNGMKRIKRLTTKLSADSNNNDTSNSLNGYDHNSIIALESILDRGQEMYPNYHHQQQQLDPYIDAVQVKSRINNKRGARVKALGSPQDHEPNPSYYSKTVHVETSSKEEHDDWETDDESDYEDHYDHVKHDYKEGHYSGHGADKKHGGKKKVYKVKAYLGSGKKKKRKKNNHYYYLHGGGGGKHGASGYGYGADKHGGKKYGKGKKGYKKKKKKTYVPEKKKIAYAYIYKKPKAKQHYGYDHHDHDDHGKYKYLADKYHHGVDKYKMVHMDHHHKGGKMSVAGLLGYTLLCVNYLLVLKQPTYDKYNSHGYTKYSPHGHHHHGKGELVHVEGGGPVILAHCAELHDKQQQQQLQQQLKLNSIKPRFVRFAPTEISKDNFMKSSSNDKKQTNASLELAESYNHHHSDDDDHHHDDGDHSSALYYLRNNARSSSAGSPPAYYYTLSPSYGSNQYSVGNPLGGQGYSSSDYDTLPGYGGGSGFLSPIQNYLNRLLMPTSVSGSDYNHYDDNHSDDHHSSYAPIRVVGSPRARLVTNTRKMGSLRAGGRIVIGADGRTLGVNNARLIVVDGQPQVVAQRDNLADLRSRQVDIQMHVIRRKFTGAQQMVNLPEEADFILARRGNLGIQLPIAVRAPNRVLQANEQMQADQPAMQQQDNINANNSSSSTITGDNLQILDLPEYALSGDSIELTCNHRIPISRLYSVKWFKDSLEFYRYIPANGARSKSSLFLPDVRLDLGRSNSQMLYLRNVTHRTSGLYRCEVVSEGPNFETVSGEKRMQVYTLPDSGPQLNLLERAQLPASTPPPLSPLTTVSVITPGQPRHLVQQLSGERENTPGSNFLSGFSDTNQQQRDSVSIDGPLVRCSSTRSSPVAQLRFFINNQPVELNRTLENSTVSYSDGTESNVVSFKIALSDFIMFDEDGQQDSVLDRAASKKNNSSNSDTKPVSLALTLDTAIKTTTTTTSTTTPKPSSEPDKRFYANANVQFDDQNVSMKKGDFKVGVKAKAKVSASASADKKEEGNNKGKNKRMKKKKKNEKKIDKQSEITNKKVNGYPNDDDEFSNLDEDSDATDESSEFSSAGLHSLPVAGDKTNNDNIKRKSDLVLVKANISPSAELGGKLAEIGTSVASGGSSANYKLAEVSSKTASGGNRNKREASTKSESMQGGGSYDEASSSRQRNKYQSPNNHLNNNKNNRNNNELDGGQLDNPHLHSRDTTVQSNQEEQHLRLSKQEQRVRQTNLNSNSNSNRVSEVYSNYIRIKCTSLVPAVGYEMTSELNVPLTVLVPARQISDALRQPNWQQREREQNLRLRDFETASRRRQQQQQQGDDESSNLSSGSRFAIRNGGSLQAPRAVLIDRLAQASSPEPSSGGASKTFLPSRNSNSSSPSTTNTFSSAPASRFKSSSNKQALRNTNSTSSAHEQQRIKQQHSESASVIS